MKIVITASLLLLLHTAQPQSPKQIQITGNKFTYFLFSDTIKRVDVGTDQIHADYDVSSVKITPLMADFPETSLFIMMTNGHYKYYVVNYADRPEQLVYDYRVKSTKPKTSPEKGPLKDHRFQFSPFFPIERSTQKRIVKQAKKVLNTPPNIYDVAVNKSKVLTKLDNVAYDGAFIYLKFNIENAANIDYHHDFCKFFIINKRGLRRKGMQETELTPIMKFHPSDTVKKDAILPLVFAFEKFTITDGKKLRTEFWESQGDRKTAIFIGSHEILNASKF